MNAGHAHQALDSSVADGEQAAAADGRVKVGHATILAAAPPEALPALIEAAPQLAQAELQQRVSAARRAPATRTHRAAALNERRAAQALRWLRLVEGVEASEDGPVRRLLAEARARLDELLAAAGAPVD